MREGSIPPLIPGDFAWADAPQHIIWGRYVLFESRSDPHTFDRGSNRFPGRVSYEGNSYPEPRLP